MDRYKAVVIVWVLVVIGLILAVSGCEDTDAQGRRLGRYHPLPPPPFAPPGLECVMWRDSNATNLNGPVCYFPEGRPDECR